MKTPTPPLRPYASGPAGTHLHSSNQIRGQYIRYQACLSFPFGGVVESRETPSLSANRASHWLARITVVGAWPFIQLRIRRCPLNSSNGAVLRIAVRYPVLVAPCSILSLVLVPDKQQRPRRTLTRAPRPLLYLLYLLHLLYLPAQTRLSLSILVDTYGNLLALQTRSRRRRRRRRRQSLPPLYHRQSNTNLVAGIRWLATYVRRNTACSLEGFHFVLLCLYANDGPTGHALIPRWLQVGAHFQALLGHCPVHVHECKPTGSGD